MTEDANVGKPGDVIFPLFIGLTITLGVLALAFSALLMWWSYRRYTHAQITSAFNK